MSEMIEQKIKPILESLAYRGARPIDRQRCDVADVQVLGALTVILALIASEQQPMVEALKAVHIEFDAIKHTRLLSFSEMQLDKKIDAALAKGEWK